MDILDFCEADLMIPAKVFDRGCASLSGHGFTQEQLWPTPLVSIIALGGLFEHLFHLTTYDFSMALIIYRLGWR